MEETNFKDCKCGNKADWKEILYVRAGITPLNCYQLIQCMNCKVVIIKDKLIKH